MRLIYLALFTLGLLVTLPAVLLEDERVVLAQTEVEDEPSRQHFLASDIVVVPEREQPPQPSTEELEQELKRLKEVLATSKMKGDFSQAAETLGEIGDVYFRLRQYQQIVTLFAGELEESREHNQAFEQLILNVMERRLQGVQRGWGFSASCGQANDFQLQSRLLENAISWQEILEISQLNLFLIQHVGTFTNPCFGYSGILHSIGWTYRNLGSYAQGLKFLKEAVDLETQLYTEPGQLLLVDLATTYIDLGQYEKALENLQNALLLKQQSCNCLSCNCLCNVYSKMGLAHKYLGEYDKALFFLQKALLFPNDKERRNVLTHIASVYTLKQDYAQALSFYNQALELSPIAGEQSTTGVILNGIGAVYARTGDIEKSFSTYQKALAFFRYVDDRAGERTTLSNIASLLAEKDQIEAAIVFYKEAVNVSEAIRQDNRELPLELQKTYVESIANTYRNLADLLLSQGRIPEAERVLELLRIEEVREYSRGAVLDPQTRRTIVLSSAEEEIYDEFDSLIAFAADVNQCEQDAACRGSQRYKDLAAQQEALTTEYNAAIESFRQEVQSRRSGGELEDNPVAANLLSGVGADIISENPNTVVISPIVLEEKLWILWVTQTGVANAIEVPVREAEINQAVFEFRALMRGCEVRRCVQTSDIQAIQQVSQRLYRWLIPPQIEAELKQNKIQNLVFSPDWTLRYIPMSALFDGQHYLIENYTVSTITGTSVGNHDQPLPAAAQTSVLALGLSESVPANPTEGIPAFGPLDNVPIELDTIVREPNSRGIAGIYQGVEKLNQAFNQDAFLDVPGHQILHIATHGYFDPSSLDASYLILGDKSPWRISAINNIQSRFRDLALVVLSACETAVGLSPETVERGTADGREVSSVAYAFLSAGANHVVASLWQVNDEATSLLMQQFYRELAADNVPNVSQALAAAQRSLLTGRTATGETLNRSDLNPQPDGTVVVQSTDETTATAHPYYWSSFIVIGNGR